MIDMSGVMIAKSDQINAADLIGKPRTIKITGVKLTGKDQATEIKIDRDDKFYRPCKSMVRVMARAWGIDGEKWIGQSATLYCDPKVKFGAEQPGGIRISHMSGLREKLAICLQAKKGLLTTYVIEPLPTQRTVSPAAPLPGAAVDTPQPDAGQSVGAASNEDRAAEWAATHIASIRDADREALAALASKAKAKLANRADLLTLVRDAIGERNEALDTDDDVPADDDRAGYGEPGDNA